MITASDVKTRLREAADVDHRLPIRGLRPAGYKTTWPFATGWTGKELYEWNLMQEGIKSDLKKWMANPRGERPMEPHKATLRPAVPTPQEIDRMFEAFGWIPLVDDIRQRKVLLAWAYKPRTKVYDPRSDRYRTASLGDIAEMARVSISTVKRLVDNAAATIAVEISTRKKTA